MNDDFIKHFFNLINKNKKKKKLEIDSINNFQSIYNIINYYEPQMYTYDEIITNSDIRLEFLANAVNIAFTNKNMDQNTVDVILQMFEGIYNYLYKESDLEEIEIPCNLKENLFNRMFIPNYSQLTFATTLLKENKRIFDSEFDGRDFSQTINEGLHKNITEVLRIEKNNLPHLLGLTNDGSLYEFYRKTFINNKIAEIIESLNIKNPQNKNFDTKEFNKKFKKFFGLNYNQENYIKLINWRYNAKEDYLKRKGIVVTEDEKEILNKTCDFTPKSKTLDFYCNEHAIDLLIKENSKVSDFVYEYIRKHIVEKCNTKNGKNELKQILKEDELKKIFDKNINSNKKTIREIINKYVEQKNYKFEDEKNFKDSFINKFGYSYPLINYNELISKNISFYNFSLFKNLNSIIVDYDSSGKKIETDVFLVSYAKKKIKSIKKMVEELISKKDKKYDKVVANNSNDDNLDNNYIMNLKSLLSFPVEDRYYFRFGFTEKDKRKQDDRLIEESTEKNDNITLIGFKISSDEEKNRISSMEYGEMLKIDCYLSCETNITSNYHQYMTDFTRRGIEYPIDMLVESEEGELRKTRILKISKPMDCLNQYIKLFNNNYNKNINYEYLKEYEIWLIDNIIKNLYKYKVLKELKIKTMKYRLETRGLNQNEIIKYETKINNEIKNLKEFELYYNRVKQYFRKYNNYIDEKTKENNISINKRKRR